MCFADGATLLPDSTRIATGVSLCEGIDSKERPVSHNTVQGDDGVCSCDNLRAHIRNCVGSSRARFPFDVPSHVALVAGGQNAQATG